MDCRTCLLDGLGLSSKGRPCVQFTLSASKSAIGSDSYSSRGRSSRSYKRSLGHLIAVHRVEARCGAVWHGGSKAEWPSPPPRRERQNCSAASRLQTEPRRHGSRLPEGHSRGNGAKRVGGWVHQRCVVKGVERSFHRVLSIFLIPETGVVISCNREGSMELGIVWRG